MEQNRKTLTESLTPKITPAAFALIKEGTPKPQTSAPILPVAPAVPQQRDDKEVQAFMEPIKGNQQKGRELETLSYSPITVRLPSRILEALLRAASERKLKRLQPYTQQDIVAEALQTWLQKHGYLTAKG